ncbi:MAG: hypothetical protein J0M15_04045 [Deltaproteobacteria bacterium]|nr:hypothetical protein [Deltaproteobacteria bacterium]
MKKILLLLFIFTFVQAIEKNQCVRAYHDSNFRSNDEWVKYIKEAQKVFDRPFDFIAATRVLMKPSGMSKDESLYLMRTYDTDIPGLTFPVPLTGISTIKNGVVTKYLQEAYRAMAYEYLEGDHKYKNERAVKIAQELERHAQDIENHFDERSYFYMIKNPLTLNEGLLKADRFSSFLMLYDGSKYNGELKLTRMERILNEDFQVPFSELRPNEEEGIVELFHGYNHSDPELKGLNHFLYLLKEAGTYIDMQFLKQKRPVRIRILASSSRSRLYEKVYGFKIQRNFQIDEKNKLIWLEMSGEDFINRFGSRWSEWQERLHMPGAPPRYLGNSIFLRNEILVYLHYQNKEYNQIRYLLSQGKTVSRGGNEPPYTNLAQLGSFWDFVNDKMEFRVRPNKINGFILF